jgi:hypothetical protein
MEADHLDARRRVVLVLTRRYLAADRALRAAQEEARSWFPSGARRAPPPIGHPGSPIRRAYDRRARLVAQLEVAHGLLHEARRRSGHGVRILALPRR